MISTAGDGRRNSSMQRCACRSNRLLAARHSGKRRDPRALPAGRGRPELVVISEHLQRLVVARRLDPRKNSAKDCVADRRRVPHVKIDWIELIPQVELGIVVQGAAMKSFVAARDPPADQIAERVMVQMQVERDLIIQAEILPMDRIALKKT